jgi:hypothetical protein
MVSLGLSDDVVIDKIYACGSSKRHELETVFPRVLCQTIDA